MRFPLLKRALIARVDACDLQPFAFQGWLGKRLTISFGWRYDFETGGFAPTAPIPALLQPRSLYHLRGGARHLWEHSIGPIDVPRWSFTFRSLSEKGRRIAS